MSLLETTRQQIGARFSGIFSIYGNTAGVYLVLIVMFVMCSIFVPNFFSVQNVYNLLQHSVVLGLVSFGQTFVIIGASLDLSVAAAVSAIAVSTALMMHGSGGNIAGPVAAALGIGVGIGFVNGWVVTKLRVNPFIATLGTSLIIQGFLFARSDTFYGGVPRSFEVLGYGSLFGFPLGAFLMLLIAFGAFYLLRYTRFGQHLYAIGGNKEIARLSGIRTDRVLIIAHILSGLGAALAGIFIVSRLRSAAPWVGAGLDLDSIAATVIGGAPLMGGQGSIWGTVAGVLILSILVNIFNILNVGAFAQLVLRGIIVIMVVAFYSLRLQKN